jgi:hypothetical protein
MHDVSMARDWCSSVGRLLGWIILGFDWLVLSVERIGGRQRHWSLRIGGGNAPILVIESDAWRGVK